MDTWHRAIAFMRALDQGIAEEVRPFQWGRGLINRQLNLVHDANYLVADHVGDAVSARDLTDAAERVQANLGLQHRRVNVDDQAAADRLASQFEALGYVPERFVIMSLGNQVGAALHRASAVEVDWPRVRVARSMARKQESWATPPLVEQLMRYHELHAQLVPTRYFAALVGGSVVSSCELRAHDGIAQIETVETLPEFRQRGLARSVVATALQAARGHELIFLVADCDDWPQHFYARLGFEAVGVETRFLHLLQ